MCVCMCVCVGVHMYTYSIVRVVCSVGYVRAVPVSLFIVLLTVVANVVESASVIVACEIDCLSGTPRNSDSLRYLDGEGTGRSKLRALSASTAPTYLDVD